MEFSNGILNIFLKAKIPKKIYKFLKKAIKLDDKEHKGVIICYVLIQLIGSIPEVLDAYKKYAKKYKKLHFGLADIKNPEVNGHMGQYSGGGKRI